MILITYDEAVLMDKIRKEKEAKLIENIIDSGQFKTFHGILKSSNDV